MNKTNLLFACVALLFGVSSAQAQTPVAETPTATVTLTPSIVSQYMFRGVRLGGPSFEPNAEFDFGNLAFGVWANFPTSDKVDGVSDPEIDPYGSYTFTLNENLSITPGFTWYTYPHAKKSNGFYKSTFEPSLALNYTVSGIKLTPKLYYDVVMHGPTYELSASWSAPLKNFGTELDFLATIGRYDWKKAAADTSPDLRNYGNYWLVGVSAPITINASSKFVVGFAYTQGRSNFYEQNGSPKVENTAAVGRNVVTISYNFTF